MVKKMIPITIIILIIIILIICAIPIFAQEDNILNHLMFGVSIIVPFDPIHLFYFISPVMNYGEVPVPIDIKYFFSQNLGLDLGITLGFANIAPSVFQIRGTLSILLFPDGIDDPSVFLYFGFCPIY